MAVEEGKVILRNQKILKALFSWETNHLTSFHCVYDIHGCFCYSFNVVICNK